MEKDINQCEQLTSYFLKELTPLQREQFEQHLAQCSSCQDELKELEGLWDVIPFTVELIEPPSGMKDKIMDAVFETHFSAESESVKEAMADIRAHTSASVYPGFRNWGLLSAAIVILLLGAYLLGNLHGKSDVANAPRISPQSPWNMQKTVALKPVDPALSNSTGNVWFMQQGDSVQVILHAKGLPATQGSESYQMWMTSGDKKWSCGTFQVGKDGSGILLYTLKNGAVQYDSLGVTLEPDAAGKQPRGRKVLGI
ncbi:anti-sigma factor [Paenibacillus sp. GP183]|uniref:anti-sigma factor n=1 Tax=Paenibacillus sp. GP183 TaxID=1882751 RepID=UPI00089C49FF|nr:anti-sigma factor [Paenibacillus sp. GP183]SEB42551.1 Putative zinc-finger [Paenibacillus sp. GP183]